MKKRNRCSKFYKKNVDELIKKMRAEFFQRTCKIDVARAAIDLYLHTFLDFYVPGKKREVFRVFTY